jgi:hypothetical protein
MTAPTPDAEHVQGEVTAAVRRATIAAAHRAGVGFAALDSPTQALHLDVTRTGLAAALDVEEMARAADPKAFEDHPIERRSQVAALQWAARRKIATDHARAIRAAILGGEA